MKTLSTNQATKLESLRNNDYFSNLDDGVLARLSKSMTLRRFEAGEVIFWQDDPCAGLYLLRRGSVKLFKLSPKGRELIIKVFYEGATFNEVPVFDLGLSAINVAALEECEIWIVDADEIRACLREHPGMAQAVILNLCKNLRMLVGTV